MEKLMIFDTKSKMIYQGYFDYNNDFVSPTWTDWNPFMAFNLSLETVASKDDDFDFPCSLGRIENASAIFQNVLEGISFYNEHHSVHKFDASLIITTFDELKKKYKRENDKDAYLDETDPDRAALLFKENNRYPTTFQTFRAGVKWAWHQDNKDK